MGRNDLTYTVYDKISKIKNQNTKDICEKFYNNEKEVMHLNVLINKINSYRKLIDIISMFDLQNFCFDDLKTLFINNSEQKVLLFKFFQYVYKNKLSYEMKNNDYIYKFFSNMAKYDLLYDICNNKVHPEQLVYCDNANKVYVVVKSNLYISKLITEFFNSRTIKLCTIRVSTVLCSYLYSKKVRDIYSEMSDLFIEEFFKNCGNLNDSDVSLCKQFFIWIEQNMTKAQLKKCLLYTIEVLNRSTFYNDFQNGFRPVLYNKFDSIPIYDSWMLKVNGEEKTSTQISAQSVLSIDFSTIENNTFRLIAKKFVWNASGNIITKIGDLKGIKLFLKLFYSDKNTNYSSIESSICANYKSYIQSKYNKTETRNSKIYPISKFLKFIESSGEMSVDKNCYLFLTNKGSLNQKGAKDVPEEDLKKIAAYFNEHKHDSLDCFMSYTVFHICLNTEFRISQIVTLSTNCVRESMKKGEYVILSKSKVSGGKEIKHPCALVLKKIIDEYLKYTAELREKCPKKSIKDYLFFTYDEKKNIYNVFNRQKFSNYLLNVCKELSITEYTAKNLRATYITNAKEYVMKNNLSDATLLGITGHKNVNTVNNHYIQEQIRDALQATNNIIIGNVDINGEIVRDKNDINSSDEVLVESKCGFCQNNDCNTAGPLSCLLCSHFATTVDRIPFFKKKIKELDSMIANAENNHDVEDIVNLKRLFARYLEELLKLKENS